VKWNWGRTALVVLACAVLIAAAGFAAPFVEANRFQQPLREALEKTLGRKVELRDLRYRMFPAPGLSAEDVIIGDAPRFGLEPIAYVGTLQVDVSPSTLWRGRLVVGGVRLVDASVNLALSEDAGWNFNDLLGQMAAGTPDFKLRNGRINFRTGTVKSAFYLNEVELDLKASPNGYQWNYEASPARTDRAETGFGRFIGQGRWHPGAGENEVEIELELERSATTDVMILLTGRDLGVPGRVASRARLAGPAANLKVTGSFQFEGLERSGIFALRGPALRLPYSGELSISRQMLHLATPDSGKVVPPVAVSIDVTSLLTNPRWAAAFRLDKIPAASVVELARRLGAAMPAELAVTGSLEGSIRLAGDAPPAGQVELSGAQVRMGEGGALAVEKASLDLSGESLVLAPSRVRSESGAEVEVSGTWSVAGDALEFRLSGEGLPLEELQSALGRTPRTTPVPLFEKLGNGAVSGALEYRRDAAGKSAWRGDFGLAGAAVSADGLPPSLVVERAQVSLRGDDFTLRKARFTQPGAAWDGELTWRASAARPLRFRLAAAEASGAALEAWLRPAVASPGGFIERTLRFRRAPAPAWLRARRAEGEVSIATLHLGEQNAGRVQARIYWDSARIDIPSLDADWEEARFSGRMSVRLASPAPAYHLLGRLDNLTWQEAHGEAEIDASAAGFGAALASTFRLEANFSARGVPLGDETARLMSGCLDLTFDRTGPKARLRCFEMTLGSETFSGQGTTQPDGRLVIDASNPRRALRVSGTLRPLELEIEPSR
jgi:hypothetical protein